MSKKRNDRSRCIPTIRAVRCPTDEPLDRERPPLPIMQLKELAIDRERWAAWKERLDEKPRWS